jgi:hypothetical protein
VSVHCVAVHARQPMRVNPWRHTQV